MALEPIVKNGGKALTSGPIGDLNDLLVRTERTVAPTAGLLHRPWYRNLLSAPGWYTGYSPKTLPGIREAIEGKRWREAEAEAARLAGTIEDEAALIERMTHTLLSLVAGGGP